MVRTGVAAALAVLALAAPARADHLDKVVAYVEQVYEQGGEDGCYFLPESAYGHVRRYGAPEGVCSPLGDEPYDILDFEPDEEDQP
jgi:hypothetical protein